MQICTIYLSIGHLFGINASLEVKQGLIGSIFTGNIYFEDNRVRTTKVNEVIEMICGNRKVLHGDKKRLLSKNQRQSCEVIPTGFEPVTHSLEGCCSIQLSYGTSFINQRQNYKLNINLKMYISEKIMIF